MSSQQHIIRDLYSYMSKTLVHSCIMEKKRIIAKGGMYFKNEFFKTPFLERIHIEHAHTVPGATPDIQVFHSTMLPDPATNFPVVLGVDLVRVNGVYTLAIADATVVDGDALPKDYEEDFLKIHTKWWRNVPTSTRPMPEWGGQLFSDKVVYLGAPMDTDRFVNYVHDVVDMHIDYEPAQGKKESSRGIKKGLQKYCALQRSNKKTFNILENCLGTSLAHEYMEKIMFPY